MSDIHIHDYSTGELPTGQTWDTTELQRDFKVLGFCAPYVTVRRRSDGRRGLLQFSHSPRVYWGFEVL